MHDALCACKWIVIIYHCLQDNHVSFVSVIFINFIILGHIVQPYTHVIIFSTMFASNKILIYCSAKDLLSNVMFARHNITPIVTRCQWLFS